VICEATGANVQEVANAWAWTTGWAAFPGRVAGFRRKLLSKDLSAFVKIAEQVGYNFRLLKEVQTINAEQMDRFLKKITETLWVLKDKRIGILGLAFKQNTDDIRMSPAIELCHRLQKEGPSSGCTTPKRWTRPRGVAGRDLRRGHE